MHACVGEQKIFDRSTLLKSLHLTREEMIPLGCKSPPPKGEGGRKFDSFVERWTRPQQLYRAV